ncbi:MAG: hypothetical protein AMXMBFR8_06410 [Nevskiales bacterium]
MKRFLDSGFTLLELLVVMFIIGIVAAMATLSVGVATSDRTADRELQRIADLLHLAGEEAVLQGREFGVTFYSQEYEFSTYDIAANRWSPFGKGSEPFSPRRFPPEALVDLEIEGRIVRLDEMIPPDKPPQRAGDRQDGSVPDPREPQVLILSSGEFTPFQLRLQQSVGARGATLRVTESGTAELIRNER